TGLLSACYLDPPLKRWAIFMPSLRDEVGNVAMLPTSFRRRMGRDAPSSRRAGTVRIDPNLHHSALAARQEPRPPALAARRARAGKLPTSPSRVPDQRITQSILPRTGVAIGRVRTSPGRV